MTFQEGPADPDGGVVYEVDDPGAWNAAVAAQNRGEDPFGEQFAAALSLPYGAATAGRDGDVFHPGFMVLRLASERPCVGDGKSDGTPVSSAGGDEAVGAGGGTVDKSGSVGASSGAEEAEPVDGASGRGAAVPKTADHEAEPGGSLGPPPLPPEATRRTPGMFTIRRAQEDILRAVYDEPAPDISPDDLPAVLVHELAAPLTVEEALSGPYAKLWKHAMRGELGGHLDTGTFEQLDATS